MKKLIVPSSIILSLLLVGGGCSASQKVTVDTTAPVAAGQAAPAPATGDSSIKQKLVAANITFTESSEMGDAAKLATAASVTDATKFKFTGGQGSVRVLVMTVKDASQLAAVKAELVAQYDILMKISSSARIEWLLGDATHLVVMNFKAGDEAEAAKIKASLK